MFTKENANLILRQLCRGNLTAIIGAYNFIFSSKESYVSFKFKGSRVANYVKIELTPLDLYKMTFMKVSTKAQKTIKEFDMVYNDMLTDVFEDTTKLVLNL